MGCAENGDQYLINNFSPSEKIFPKVREKFRRSFRDFPLIGENKREVASIAIGPLTRITPMAPP